MAKVKVSGTDSILPTGKPWQEKEGKGKRSTNVVTIGEDGGKAEPAATQNLNTSHAPSPYSVLPSQPPWAPS